MLCLQPKTWLNDEVINFFMELLKGRSSSRDDLPRVHFFNTMFYAKLTKEGSSYDYTGVKRWTRKLKLFEYDLLVCPVHVHGNHWCLAVVNFLDKRFEYYDSLRVRAVPASPCSRAGPHSGQSAPRGPSVMRHSPRGVAPPRRRATTTFASRRCAAT